VAADGGAETIDDGREELGVDRGDLVEGDADGRDRSGESSNSSTATPGCNKKAEKKGGKNPESEQALYVI
jgi:hypothetical protein